MDIKHLHQIAQLTSATLEHFAVGEEADDVLAEVDRLDQPGHTKDLLRELVQRSRQAARESGAALAMSARVIEGIVRQLAPAEAA